MKEEKKSKLREHEIFRDRTNEGKCNQREEEAQMLEGGLLEIDREIGKELKDGARTKRKEQETWSERHHDQGRRIARGSRRRWGCGRLDTGRTTRMLRTR